MIAALRTTAPTPAKDRRSPAQDRPDPARAAIPDRVRSPLPHKLGGHGLATEVGARQHLGAPAIPLQRASDPEQPDEPPAKSP
jgi:hypothetical protein